MNVHGCTDAYLRADVLPLPGGLTVHLPQPPNYAVLKLHAWLDRSADHDYKDGPDLALVVHWYAGDLDRLYAKPDQWALRRHDFDLRTAAAAARPRHARQCQRTGGRRAGDARHTGRPRPAGPALRRGSTGLAHHHSFAAPAGRGVTRPAHAGLLNANRNHKCTFSNGASYRIG